MLCGREQLWWAQRSHEELGFPNTKIIFPDQKLRGSGAEKTGMRRGRSRGCAKPYKSQWCGLKLHWRKSFLARFGNFPSTTSIFPTKPQRRRILITTSAKPYRGAQHHEGEVRCPAAHGDGGTWAEPYFSPHWG